MGGNTKLASTRRAVLTAVGSGLAPNSIASVVGANIQRDSQFALVQGGKCVPVRPIDGQVSVEAFYGYHLPPKYVSDANGAVVGESQYVSAGTTDLQRATTSIAFLYRGPHGVSLVTVHGSTRHAGGGAATFRFSGLPADGKWVVKDDFYRNPDTNERAASNYDWWQVTGTTHRIDWTWGDRGTDGGAFRDLGDDFKVVIRPAFNEAATLYNQYYTGTITDWEFLSGSAGGVERLSLDLSKPIRLTTGECNDS